MLHCTGFLYLFVDNRPQYVAKVDNNSNKRLRFKSGRYTYIARVPDVVPTVISQSTASVGPRNVQVVPQAVGNEGTPPNLLFGGANIDVALPTINKLELRCTGMKVGAPYCPCVSEFCSDGVFACVKLADSSAALHEKYCLPVGIRTIATSGPLLTSSGAHGFEPLDLVFFPGVSIDTATSSTGSDTTGTKKPATAVTTTAMATTISTRTTATSTTAPSGDPTNNASNSTAIVVVIVVVIVVFVVIVIVTVAVVVCVYSDKGSVQLGNVSNDYSTGMKLEIFGS